MPPWRALCGWRSAAVLGAGLLAAASCCHPGRAELDWRPRSLDEFEVRVDEGAAAEAAFHKRFYRAVRTEKTDIAAARTIYRELLAERPETAYLYFKLAQLDFRQRQLKPCIEHLETALEHDPKLRAAYDVLGHIYSFRNRDDELIALYERAAEHIKPDNIKYYLAIGKLHEKHDRSDEAMAVYKRAVAEHPPLYRPWLKLFDLQLDAGDTDEAYQTFREALEATGGHRALLVGVRDLYLDSDDEARAFELIELLVDRFPYNANFWRDFIAGLLSRGRVEEARATFKKSLSYLRGEPGYLANIVELYGRHGDVDEAITVFEHALESEPDSVDIIAALALNYAANGQADNARAMRERLLELELTGDQMLAVAAGYERSGGLQAFGEWARRAADLLPDSFDAQFALLRYSEEAGERDQTSAVLDRIFGKEAQPEPEMYIRVGSVSLSLSANLSLLEAKADYYEHRIPEALKSLETLTRHWSGLVEAHFYLGLCYRRLGQYDEAVKSLERAVSVSSASAWRWVELGKALRRAGREEEAQEKFAAALKALETAVRDAPNHVGSQLRLAATLSEAGRTEDAAREFKRAIEIEPDSAEALNGLGYMWAEAGKHLDEALKLIERALEIEPDNGAIVDSLGWVYFKQGRHTNALRELQRAVKLAPPTAEIYDHLGDTHLALGDEAKAIEWWNKALELYPEDAAAVRKKIVAHGGTPSVEEPSVEEPPVEEPSVEEPSVEEPSVEEPSVEEPSVEEPSVEEPPVEEPPVEEPSVG
jgi:tetratricopeptide (TPR) repeat protein